MPEQKTQPDDSQRLLDAARHVIAREVEGLEAVSKALNGQFLSVVEKIFALKGRVIICGMGKSGHIGRKIAATMASTGTPAFFVHPSEASHGDLGMITADDLVICLSNSGETHELRDVIAYSKRFGIPLVALVRRETSALVDSADIAIILPEVPEASPIGAPTTSTTMMLAYGDALAMALLEKRGFTKEDFGVYHPGGKLGTQLMRVANLMHDAEELPLVDAEADMPTVLLTMTAKHFGCAGVVKNGVLQGIITDGDLRRHIDTDLMKQTARQVMTANPITITPQMLATEALGIMNTRNITVLFALDAEAKPVGILHIHDCLRAGIL